MHAWFQHVRVYTIKPLLTLVPQHASYQGSVLIFRPHAALALLRTKTRAPVSGVATRLVE